MVSNNKMLDDGSKQRRKKHIALNTQLTPLHSHFYPRPLQRNRPHHYQIHIAVNGVWNLLCRAFRIRLAGTSRRRLCWCCCMVPCCCWVFSWDTELMGQPREFRSSVYLILDCCGCAVLNFNWLEFVWLDCIASSSFKDLGLPVHHDPRKNRTISISIYWLSFAPLSCCRLLLCYCSCCVVCCSCYTSKPATSSHSTNFHLVLSCACGGQ